MTEERTRTTEREHDKLLVDTAVTAGEIMLVSGAEIYRVEDTVRADSFNRARSEGRKCGAWNQPDCNAGSAWTGKPDGNAPDPEPVCQSESGMQSQ